MMRMSKYKAYVPMWDKVLDVMAIFFDENMVTVKDRHGDYRQYRFDEVELMEYTGVEDYYNGEILFDEEIQMNGKYISKKGLTKLISLMECVAY